ELRFRPIVMTSFAFILGVVPLAVATGASMNSQRAIGTGVLGGMVTATVLAVFVTPLLFVLIARASPSRQAMGTKGRQTEAASTHGIPAG
ncbi:efflux RND transporter permease subunit, partial [Methylobacterium sp. CCH5-D2]